MTSCSWIVQIAMRRIWHARYKNVIGGLERMPESPPFEEGIVQPCWRGDTMNSSRTLFGREIVELCVGGDEVDSGVSFLYNSIS